MEGILWNGLALTVAGGPRTANPPFQCSYMCGVNWGVALSLSVLVAALKKFHNPDFVAPEGLLDIAANVKANFEDQPDSWLDACVRANCLGMAAARAGDQHPSI